MERNSTFNSITAGIVVSCIVLSYLPDKAATPPAKVIGQLMVTANSTASGVVFQSTPPNMVTGAEGATIIVQVAQSIDITPRST